ncbi:MAG: ATP-binding protein [Candidatus Rokuibacteriota bacterium]
MPRSFSDEASLVVNLLGGFSVSRGGRDVSLSFKRRKTLALLGYLAAAPDRTHSRSKLAALLWGERGEAEARHALRQSLFELRTALARMGRDAVRADTELIGISRAGVTSDVAAFQRLASESAPAALEAAAALYRGDLLEGFSVGESGFDEWLGAERAHLHQRAIDVLRRLLGHCIDSGAREDAIAAATRLLALDPLDEPIHRTLIRLHAEGGRRGAALRQYEACVAILRRELDVEPEAETRELHRILLLQSPAQEPAAPRGAPRGGAPFRRVAWRRRLPPSETALVGRLRELTALRRWWEDARGCREPRAVVVYGDAGIGKSRLIAELAGDVRQERGVVLYGRSREGDGVLPLAAWVEALGPGLTPQILDRLPLPWRQELGRLFPEIGVAPAAPGDKGDDLRLFQAVARALGAVAAHRACCVVLEDLHWADEMSLRLLAWLATRLERTPIMLLATARTEELADAPALRAVLGSLRREARCTALSVPPLSREETTMLVGLLLDQRGQTGDLERVNDRAWRLSEGNPFVVVEAVRSEGDGDDDAGGPLPDRVRAMTVRRLDALPGRARRLVDVAAVIGRDFELALLHRVSGDDEASVSEDIDDLVRRHLLREAGGRVDFTHDRVRTVTYESIGGSRQRLLHREVANALSNLYAANPEPHAAAVGRHLFLAGDWERASVALRQAGDVARSRGAWSDARVCFEDALIALGRLPPRHRAPVLPIHAQPPASADETRAAREHAFELHMRLAEAHHPLNGQEQRGRVLQDALSIARTLGDERRLALASTYLAHHTWMVGRTLSEATELGEQALATAERLGDRRLQILANHHLGGIYLMLGAYRDAERVLRRNLVLLDGPLATEQLAVGFPAAVSRSWLAWVLAERGQFEEARSVGEEGLRVARSLDHTVHAYSILQGSFGLANVHFLRGEWAQAIEIAESSRTLASAQSMGLWIPLFTFLLGACYAHVGRVVEGVAMLEAQTELTWKMSHSRVLICLAQAHLLQRQVERAVERANQALVAARERGEQGREATALWLLGEAAMLRNAGDGTAATYLREGLALAEELDQRPLVAHCRAGLGKLYRRTGKEEEARGHFTAATALYHAMGMTYWLHQAGSEFRELGGMA